MPILPGLAHPNVDVRRRAQAALIYLGKRAGGEVAKDLADWQPSDGNSNVEIAQFIDAWRKYWDGRAKQSAS